MVKLIELTGIGDEVALVNAEAITFVVAYPLEVHVHFGNDHKIRVKETLAELAKKIAQAPSD